MIIGIDFHTPLFYVVGFGRNRAIEQCSGTCLCFCDIVSLYVHVIRKYNLGRFIGPSCVHLFTSEASKSID